MKKTVTLLASLLFTMLMFAQSNQSGYVKQYNEKLEKTPLKGVELNIYGAASTVSDNQGAFTLSFNTLKAGDKIGYSKIAKEGYVLFNKEKLDQWNISKDNKPFTIIMCKEAKFKAIKDNYLKVSSASYARQQKKEEAALKAEYKTGKKKEAEYKKELYELRQYYAEQLKNIGTYVDQFSRIDLSELDAQEQAIIDLIQAGDIESAINRYEKLNYLEKYENEVKDVKELENIKSTLEETKAEKLVERDSIYAIVMRQVDAYKMAGGRENLDKAGKLLKECADADTTNYNVVLQYSAFAGNQNILQDEEKYTFICYRMLDHMFSSQNDMYTLQAATLENNLGILYDKLRNFKKALFYLERSLSKYQTLCSKSLLAANFYIQTAQSISNSYNKQKQLHKAFDYLTKAYEMNFKATQKFPEYANSLVLNRLDILTSMMSLSLDEFHDYDTIIKDSEIEAILAVYRMNPETRSTITLRALLNVGRAYMYKENWKDSETYLTQALDIARNMEKKNPDKDIIDYLIAYNSAASLYMQEEQYAKSETIFRELYEKVTTLHQQTPAPYEEMLHETEYNLGLLYMKKNNPSKAISLFTKAKEGFINLSGISQFSKDEYFMQMNYMLADAYNMQNNKEESFAYIMQNIEFYHKKIESLPSSVDDIKLAYDNSGNIIKNSNGTAITTLQMYYALSLNSVAYYYVSKNDCIKAIESIEEAISMVPGNPNFYDTKGELLIRQNKDREALEMYRKVLDINPKFFEQNKTDLFKQLKEKGLIQ